MGALPGQLMSAVAYLTSTEPPASSSSAFTLSASSFSTPSLMGFGASSTSALASLRPRPVAARTTLMTWIFLSPAAVRTTSKAVCSSSPPPSAAAAPPAAGAAAATAVADTPNSSSSALMRSLSSSTEMPLSSSIQSVVLVAMLMSPYASGAVSSSAPSAGSSVCGVSPSVGGSVSASASAAGASSAAGVSSAATGSGAASPPGSSPDS